jgi:transcriptional regulator with XRE-family HTH domain
MRPAELKNDGSRRAPHGTIANLIRWMRARRGWTQEQLAKRLGVDKITVIKWEAGTKCPTPTNVRRLALEFSVPEDFILAHRRVLFK